MSDEAKQEPKVEAITGKPRVVAELIVDDATKKMEWKVTDQTAFDRALLHTAKNRRKELALLHFSGLYDLLTGE